MTNSELLSTSKESLHLENLFPQNEIPIRHNTAKRSFDVLFSSVCLICGFPLFLAISLMILLSSKGKVFYAQERIGRGGVKFNCYKFRTMCPHANSRLAELLAQHPELKREWDETHKLKNDPRVTKLGAFLRKTSLDEIPQFWNVLKGDLSIVGPRPLTQEEVSTRLGYKAAKILSIRPGLTCFWQTSGRSNISYAQRIELDENYVENHNFSIDAKLILKTVFCMLHREGAF